MKRRRSTRNQTALSVAFLILLIPSQEAFQLPQQQQRRIFSLPHPFFMAVGNHPPSSALSKLPRRYLLDMLDDQGIPYSLDASRFELEQLIRSNILHPRLEASKQRRRNTNANASSQRNRPRHRPTMESTSSKEEESTRSGMERRIMAQKLPLSDLLADLDTWKIAYPPTATRAELERLWMIQQRRRRKEKQKGRSDSKCQ